MKIVCVAGGSYKSFYLNYFNKINKCDLLIFNFGIIYNYDIKEELLGNAVVTKELMSLSKALHCIVAAGVFQTNKNLKTKSIIVCDGDKIHLAQSKIGIPLHIGNKSFLIGDETANFYKHNKIVLCSKRLYPDETHCSKSKIYLFIDHFGVSFIENKKQSRKFNKISKIILK